MKNFLLKIIDFFFLITFTELFIGGGGRIFSFHEFTLRKILFSLGIVWFFYNLLQKRKIGQLELLFSGCFIIITLFGFAIGLSNHAGLTLIVLDLQQQIFFLSILYFSLYINSADKIERIINLIKYSSLFLAIAYLITIFLIQFKIISFVSFYNFLSKDSFYNELIKKLI